jgi:hypothetical protein
LSTLTLNGGIGHDLFSVRPSAETRLYINGGDPITGEPGAFPGDVLAVNLEDIGNAVVPEQVSDGTITSDRQPIVFTSIETLVGSDRFEGNRSQANATDLGEVISTFARDLSVSIHASDWFRFRANHNGFFSVHLGYLQSISNVQFHLVDEFGNLVKSSQPTYDGERLTFPATAQQEYFLRVDSDSYISNWYALEIDNLIELQHNSITPTDVNGDGYVTPLDALIVITQLNSGRVSTRYGDPILYSDVSNDCALTPLDVLLIVNSLNSGVHTGQTTTPLPPPSGESSGTTGSGVNTGQTVSPVDPTMADWLFTQGDEEDDEAEMAAEAGYLL